MGLPTQTVAHYTRVLPTPQSTQDQALDQVEMAKTKEVVNKLYGMRSFYPLLSQALWFAKLPADVKRAVEALGKAFKCVTKIKGKKKTEMSQAFRYISDRKRVIKAMDLSINPYVVRGKKGAPENKDFRERLYIMRNVDTLFASHRTFDIKKGIISSTTKDLRGMPASLRAPRDLYVLNQLHAVKKRAVVPIFAEFKRPSNTVRANNTKETASLLYTIEEKESYETFKELIGPPDTMKANQIVATKRKENTKRPKKLIRHPNIRRAVTAPDIRQALKALLEATSLLSAIGGKKTVGTSRETGETKDQRYRWIDVLSIKIDLLKGGFI